jgi:hypothetical protein
MIVFGYYGWGTTNGINNLLDASNVLTCLLVLLSSIFLYKRRMDFNSHFQKPISIELGMVLTVLGFTLLGTIINYASKSRSLTVDELSFAWLSQLHSYVLSSRLFEYLPPGFLTINSRFLVQFLALIILVSGIMLWKKLTKIQSDLIVLIISLSLTFGMRLGVQFFGGHNPPNSPLPSIWYFLSTTIFGITNFTYRISTLLVFAILATYIFRQISVISKQSKFIAFATSLLLFSTPLVDSMSTLVEIANWSFIVAVVFLYHLVANRFVFTEKILILLAVAFYLRINIISLLVSALLYIFLTRDKDGPVIRWKILYPLWIILPGSATILTGRFAEKARQHKYFLVDLQENLQNALDALFYSGSFLYLLLGLISSILLILNKSFRAFIGFLILTNMVLFLGLNDPEVSGSSKYLIEYLFPLVMLIGIWPKILILKTNRSIRNFVLVALIAVNLFGFYEKSDVRESFKSIYEPSSKAISSGYAALPFVPFAYAEAFKFVSAKDLWPCLNVGVVYSGFPDIIEGLSVSRIIKNQTYRNSYSAALSESNAKWDDVSYQTVQEAGIDCLILGAVENQLGAVKEFESNGWEVQERFIDSNFGTTVFLLVPLGSLR